jgi:SAM-dependent methyltransferase
MTAQHPLGRTLEIARIWTRICRQRSLSLWQVGGRVRRATDLGRIERLRNEMAGVLATDPTSAAKYADPDVWLPFNVDRIGRLSLHDSPPLRILDVGCGPGYFLAAARACEHDCYGVDAPATILTEVERRVYSEMLAALSLGQRVSPLLVERFTPMTLPWSGFDLITAFWICFNCHRRADEWGRKEWEFFIEDARSHLREGGILHLELNEHPERYGPLTWYDADTLDFFQSAGTVHRNIIRIRK